MFHFFDQIETVSSMVLILFNTIITNFTIKIRQTNTIMNMICDILKR